MTAGQIKGQQTLLLDADDTLWENNAHFERAIASFLTLLDDAPHTPWQIREHLNEVEKRTIARRGYGTDSFCLSLLQCFEDLMSAPPSDVQKLQIRRFADAIVQAEIELLPGVGEALRSLSLRHRLILVTKGDDLEQRDKLSRSGLREHFSGVEVLAEKHQEAYRDVALRYECPGTSTWMVGNSPKSDINPALKAGLNAVYVPHRQTWVLEHEAIIPVPDGQRLLEVGSLTELAQAM